MTDEAALRVGIVGCGGQGHALAQAVARIDELQLVACADPQRAAAARVAATGRDVTTHATLEGLLGESEVDVVLIATPHHVLAPAALAGLQAGKHVLIEKPIALNAREAAEVEAAAQQAGVCCMSGYSFRYAMAKHVHDLVAAGAVGEIQAITATIGHGRLNDGWIAYPESGGGSLLFVGSHLVDLMLWFLDKPVSVSATVRRRADTGADDTSAFSIRFASGAVAQGLTTQSAGPLFYTFDVIGRAGRVALRGANFLQYELEVCSQALPAYAQPTIVRPYVWQDNIAQMFVPELQDFTAAIRAGRPAPITARDGRRALQVLDAIVEAGRAGAPVALANAEAARTAL
jgi:UDP-N-acetyl-2-amino-2-deoxyglucuronate dehydrogenase